jgi:hypothetical protein
MWMEEPEHDVNNSHGSLGKDCVYTEDTVQTHFDVEDWTGQGGNGIGPFGYETTAGLGYGTFRRKGGQGSSQALGVESPQTRTLAANLRSTTILPNSCVDPFFKLPIRLSEQGREAIDHRK